ncbi:MAG: hypothetical protein NC124_00180 [Clostridium sp.]|nr:hypothetical protein [Clostridium sp.]
MALLTDDNAVLAQKAGVYYLENNAMMYQERSLTMKQYYKSFMDRQHPSKTLTEDTVSMIKDISGERNNQSTAGGTRRNRAFGRQGGRERLYYAAVLAVLLLIAGGIWRQDRHIIYYDLRADSLSATGDSGTEDLQKSFGEERNSYLGLDETDVYLFDGAAKRSERLIGQGTVTILSGTVKNIGYQPLYQTRPQKIKGTAVYLAKGELDGETVLFAAFAQSDQYYYLEGKQVSEREMTACIRELLYSRTKWITISNYLPRYMQLH